MEALGLETVFVLDVLGVCFIGPAIAFAFLSSRKRLARQRRRSPIGIALLRGPGHSLREQLDEVTTDLGMDVMLLVIVPLMMWVMFLGMAHLRGLAEMSRLAWMFVVAAVTANAWVIYGLMKTGARLDNLRTGYDAEVAVGQELDQLMRQGAATFHDLPGDNFNIDHVVVSSQGVFAVETKGLPSRSEDAAGTTRRSFSMARCCSFPLGRPERRWSRQSVRRPGSANGSPPPPARRSGHFPSSPCRAGSSSGKDEATCGSSMARNLTDF